MKEAIKLIETKRSKVEERIKTITLDEFKKEERVVEALKAKDKDPLTEELRTEEQMEEFAENMFIDHIRALSNARAEWSTMIKQLTETDNELR